MTEWLLEYWHDSTGHNVIEEWLDSLSKEQFSCAARELKLLEISGNTLRLPHSRALSKGLFELRERRYGYRMYYGFWQTHIIVMLAAGDKSTQKHDIMQARERLALLY